MNDTPKIVALTLMAAPFIKGGTEFVWWASSSPLADCSARRSRSPKTMSHKITAMNPGQADRPTDHVVLVLAASPMGWPLSHTCVLRRAVRHRRRDAPGEVENHRRDFCRVADHASARSAAG